MNERFLILIYLFVLIEGLSCAYKNPLERNTVVFYDRVESVQDSLKKMISIMKRLPKDVKGLNTRYEIDGKDWLVNGSIEAENGDFQVDSNHYLSPYSQSQKRQFLKLAYYLKANFITAGYFDLSVNLWVFTYREISDDNYNDSRVVIILNGEQGSMLDHAFKILDRKKDVCLIVPKDAIIR